MLADNGLRGRCAYLLVLCIFYACYAYSYIFWCRFYVLAPSPEGYKPPEVSIQHEKSGKEPAARLVVTGKNVAKMIRCKPGRMYKGIATSDACTFRKASRLKATANVGKRVRDSYVAETKVGDPG